MTSQPITLSTNFMTLIPSLTFTDYEWFPWSICNGCGMPAGNAYPSGHLVLSPILGLVSAPIVETKFLELAMSLLDFSHRILLGTFSILLSKLWKQIAGKKLPASFKMFKHVGRMCRQRADGDPNGESDGHHNTVIRPVWRRAYKMFGLVLVLGRYR